MNFPLHTSCIEVLLNRVTSSPAVSSYVSLLILYIQVDLVFYLRDSTPSIITVMRHRASLLEEKTIFQSLVEHLIVYNPVAQPPPGKY